MANKFKTIQEYDQEIIRVANVVGLTKNYKLKNDQMRYLKRLEKEMFAINPKMTSKPLWSDYLDDNGNELVPVPPLIASYVYESFSIEKRYQALDEMFIHYEKQGYRVCGYSSKHIYPLIDEYLNICKAKLADMKRLDNVILKYVSQ